MSSQPYSRREALEVKLNAFFDETFGCSETNRCKELDLDDLLKLKSVLSGINNFLTLRLTEAFVYSLSEYYSFSEAEKLQAFNFVDRTKPNTNGFDIVVDLPHKILAEVKCNIPINNSSSFGVAQRNGIVKDCRKLLTNPSRGKIRDVRGYHKYMVLPDRTKVRNAFDELTKTKYFLDISWEYFDHSTEPNNVSTDIVYVAFIDLDDRNLETGEQ